MFVFVRSCSFVCARFAYLFFLFVYSWDRLLVACLLVWSCLRLCACGSLRVRVVVCVLLCLFVCLIACFVCLFMCVLV